MMFTNNKQQGPTRLEILTPTVMHVILEFVAYNKSPLPLGSAFEVGWLYDHKSRTIMHYPLHKLHELIMKGLLSLLYPKCACRLTGSPFAPAGPLNPAGPPRPCTREDQA